MTQPHPIETLRDSILNDLKDHSNINQKWLIGALAKSMGLVAALGDRNDPVEALRDIGDALYTTVAMAMRADPERASKVAQALVDDVEELLVDNLDWIRCQVGRQSPRSIRCQVERQSPGRILGGGRRWHGLRLIWRR